MSSRQPHVWLFGVLCALFCTISRPVLAAGPTDTLTWGGSVARNGYETTHNMDPAIVGSPSFGQIFMTNLPGNFNGIGPEQVYSQPLVYTGSDGVQYVYIATTQNNIYKLDAKTGAIVAKRNLWVPFLQADLGNCADITPTIGVTGTGVIDDATGIWYFTAKTYSSQFQGGKFSPQQTPGRLNARYYFHGINTQDLSDAFTPTSLEGTVFRNNPNRTMISGNQHQRPALLLAGNYIYTGWASHCIQYNYTGAIMGFNKATGAIVEAFSTEAGPEPNTVAGAGVWMSGGGLSYDGSSIFFATGNGYAAELPATGYSLSGRQPPPSLEEAAVNAKVNSDGTLSVIDFFMPYEKVSLDNADMDLGTSPLVMLPSSTFSCPNQGRIGMVTGKSGKTYWLNLDNLGGYQMAANKQDNVIQVFQNENIVYSSPGVMPLGGGYVYVNVIGYQTHVFKFGCDASGNAAFTKVSDTPESNAKSLGVGHGATTSLNGQDGTGLLWVSDIEGLNLRIYNPIPPAAGGDLVLVNSFNAPGVTKFSRPVFGDGRAYVVGKGVVYGFGSPVSLPLNCSSPYTFNDTLVGNTSAPLTVTCLANVQTTLNAIALTGNPNFNLSGLPSLPLALQQGATFSFSAAFVPKAVGLLSSDVVANTTNAVAGYSVTTPITLKGKARSSTPVLAVSPKTVSFGTVVGQGTDDQTAILSNTGDALLTIQNITYSQAGENGMSVTPNITSDGSVQVGAFTFRNVPTTIPNNTAAPITISFVPTTPGNQAVFLNITSNGGSSLLDILGLAYTPPIGYFDFQTPDGSGWVPYSPTQNFTFGNVTDNTTRNLKFRVTNNGSVSAGPLKLTVSKPPYGLPEILGASNNLDLSEGTLIPAGQSATANLYCNPPSSQLNLPSYTQTVQWTMNTNDLTSGKHFFQFSCTAVTSQVGPLLSNGTAQYGYLGCASDSPAARQMAVQIYADANNNTNGRCTSACFAQGWTFAATEYAQECWCGNALPRSFLADSACNYQCTGDNTTICGGNVGGTGTAMSLFADSTKFNGSRVSPPLTMVQSYQNYTYAGCYAESNGKSLTGMQTINNRANTVEYCGSICSAANYSSFGVEYGAECYCGNSIVNSPTLTSDSQCNMLCAANNSEYCGAGNRMQIYSLNANNSSSSTSTTASSTTTISTATGSTVISSTAVSSSTATSSTASSSTITSSATTSSTTTAISTTTTGPSTTTSSTTSASPTSTGPVPPAQIGSWTLQGCYVDSVSSRSLQKSMTRSNTLTNQACASFCSGSQFFGTEYSGECYCGDTFVGGLNGSAATDGRCNMVCNGDATQICGGPGGLTLYRSSSFVAPSAPAVVSGFGSMGCSSDSVNKRVLSSVYSNSTMTLDMCATQAAGINATYFGVEYGAECWYGSILDPSSQPLAQSTCNMKCPGNSSEWCGAGNALQLYSVLPPSSSSATTTASTTPSSTLSTGTTSASSSTSSSTSSPLSSTSTTTSSASNTFSSTSSSSSSASSTSSSTSSTPSSTSNAPSSTSSTTVSSTTSTPATLTSSTSSSASSSTPSATATQAPIVCPASNSTLWQASSGATYLIECNIDHTGGDLGMVYVSAPLYENCIQACDNTTGCLDTSLSGTACYMKKTLQPAVAYKGILGAKLLFANTTVTLTSSSSTYVTTITAGPSTANPGSTITASFTTTSTASAGH